MSLKPPKKSDLGKSWMKPRRDKNILIRPEDHLIVTEGTETEPQYFEAIRDIINSQYRDKIQLDVHGAGDNTLSLLDKAMNLVKSNPNGYKHVWIVFAILSSSFWVNGLEFNFPIHLISVNEIVQKEKKV